jgi:hypothetical protein
MQKRPQGEVHRHVALVAADDGVAPAMTEAAGTGFGFSLLRLSVPARLMIVALAAALLWLAVVWALR